jgi:hypothetical protein
MTNDGQKVMWHGVFTLSQTFSLIKAAVNLEQRANATLQNTALALEV